MTPWPHPRAAPPRALLALAALAALVLLACTGGNEDTTPTLLGPSTPPDVRPGPYTAIGVGLDHVCAITAAGEIHCWWARGGSGERSADDCAITAAGEIHCWGADDVGQANAPPGRFAALSVGGRSACALTYDGEAVCWGANGEGQAEPPPGRYTAISVSGAHACALTGTGEAVCWGSNRGGGLLLAGSYV